jgi:hypothetical protein
VRVRGTGSRLSDPIVVRLVSPALLISGLGGSFAFLEALEEESTSDIERWKQSMPWMTEDELMISFGYCQLAPTSAMSERAKARSAAVVKYCQKLKMTQVGEG